MTAPALQVAAGIPYDFGTIKSALDAENAVRDTLQLWMPTYLAEIERQSGRNPQTLSKIRDWIKRPANDRWNENMTPACVVISPGVLGVPSKTGEGYYDAMYSVGVSIVVSARNDHEMDDLAKLYGAAARAALLQHRSLGGKVVTTAWLDEQFDDIWTTKNRNLRASINLFSVELGNVVSTYGGPVDVPVQPYDLPADTVEIDTVSVTVTKEDQ